MSTPPKPGSRPSVRVDQELSDNLTTMMRVTGLTLSDAVRHAIAFMADAYATAWAQGVVPEGVEPRILAFQIARHPACPPRPTWSYTPGPTRRPTPATPPSDTSAQQPTPVRQDRSHA